MNISAWHLVSTVNGKVKVIHSSKDHDKSKVFHGRYACESRAIERARQLNEKRGY